MAGQAKHCMASRTAARRGAGAAFAAVGAALAAAQPAAADTLEELMEGCLRVMTEASEAGVAGYGLRRVDDQLRVSVRRIDGRPVSLMVKTRLDGSIHSCSVIGYTFGDDNTIAEPGLSWSEGLERGAVWLDASAAAPGRAEIAAYGPPSRTEAACTDPEREGFLMTIIPANFGSKTTDMPEDDRPFNFTASRVANPEQACGFVRKHGKG